MGSLSKIKLRKKPFPINFESNRINLELSVYNLKKN